MEAAGGAPPAPGRAALGARRAQALVALAVLLGAAPDFSGGVLGAFVPAGRTRGQPRGGRVRRAVTQLADPPAPPVSDLERRGKPKFAQCIVEYKDGSGSHGEGWLFHMDAAEEDEARAEVKPSFPRLLKKSAHIWTRGKTVTCTPLESLPYMGGPCAECVRLFTGGIYGTGVIVPAIDYANPGKAGFEAGECMALLDQQPPKDGKPAETGGGSMSGHDTKMSPFCRTNVFPGFE